MKVGLIPNLAAVFSTSFNISTKPALNFFFLIPKDLYNILTASNICNVNFYLILLD